MATCRSAGFHWSSSSTTWRPGSRPSPTRNQRSGFA
nr:MAG TPA: hypothetical protein [Caudoviricetes sp.]